MGSIKKNYSATVKQKVAIEAIQQQKTINEITAEYSVHSTQVGNWKRQALDAILHHFQGDKVATVSDRQAEIDELHRQLGQVIAERDWLKKKSSTTR